MISKYDNCLFVHIPKVAGQSVEQYFLKRAGLSWEEKEHFLLRPNMTMSMGPPRLAHLTAAEYCALGYLTHKEFEHFFKFSFVRNPWDRLISEFNYRKGLGFKSYQKSFKHFVLNKFPTKDDDNYKESKDVYRHVIPQTDFLYDDNGHCIVDFVGRFEQLQQDFDIVCDNLGVPRAKLSHKNKTKTASLQVRMLNKIKPSAVQKVHYSQYYDNVTYDFVAKYYASDIEKFNYSFEEK